ncbi:MAG: DCC1-like thiol-disulfide oxidoreductase family protein [Thermoanaerobaculia bacterium]
MDAGSPILLFDGVCNLCGATVQWVIRHDPQGIFRFAALQSAAGQAILARVGESLAAAGAGKTLDSVVLVDGERCWVRSAAALEVLRRLGGPWALLRVFGLLPRAVRDAIYDRVARRRYRWFGRRDECWLPTPELRRRFLDAGQ